MAPKPRLHVERPLAPGQSVPLSEDQARHLFAVLRLGVGDSVLLVNSRDGEWRAEIRDAGRRGGSAEVVAQTRPLRMPPDLWLLFAPIRKSRTDFIVEKATELGASRILPVRTEHTNAARVRRDRLQIHAIEAVEQCGGTYVPEVCEMRPLAEVLADWPTGRRLMFCSETEAARDAAPEATDRVPARAPEFPAGRGENGAQEPWAILVGPEGGFSESERETVEAMPGVHVARLGPRILRADTAVVAAMVLWQSRMGDW